MSLPEIQDHFDSTQNSIILNNIIDMMEKFVKKIDKISKNEIFLNTFDILSINNIKTAIKDLKINIECNKRKKMKYVFFGKTSSGKSAALNALIKENILPSEIGRTTSCFITVEGCEEETGYLIDKNGTRPYYSNIMYNENDEDQETYNIDSKVTVLWPKTKCTILNNEIQFLDCPGFDYTVEQDKAIEDRCLDADVFVYVIDAVSSIHCSERKFFKKVQSKVADPNIFILINKWDECERELSTQKLEKIKIQHLETGRSFYRDDLQLTDDYQDRIFFVSAIEMLKETTTPGFDQRREEFYRFVRSMIHEIEDNAIMKKLRRHLCKGLEYLHLVLKAIYRILDTRRGNIFDNYDEIGLKLDLDSVQYSNFQVAKSELNRLLDIESQKFVYFVLENVTDCIQMNEVLPDVVLRNMDKVNNIINRAIETSREEIKVKQASFSQIKISTNLLNEFYSKNQYHKPIPESISSPGNDNDSEYSDSSNVTPEATADISPTDYENNRNVSTRVSELDIIVINEKIAKLQTNSHHKLKKDSAKSKLRLKVHDLFFELFITLLEEKREGLKRRTKLSNDRFLKDHQEVCQFIISMEKMRVSCELQINDVNSLIKIITN